MQCLTSLFILVLSFPFLAPVYAQVITCTGSKIHVAGATTVQGILITDTATRIESYGLLKANVFKNSGLIDLKTGLIIADTLRLEDGKVHLNSNATIVIDNNDTLGIKISNGKLVAPNYGWGVVQWNIGEAATGKRYTVPFVNDSLEDVSIRFEIKDEGVGTGGYVEFTTFGTDATDSPNNVLQHPDLVYFPSASAAIDSNWNFIADRMWRTVAQGYTSRPDATLTFKYADRDVSGNNAIDIEDLMLSKLNDNCWDQVTHAVIDTDFNLITIDTASAYHLWMLHDTLQQTCNPGLTCAAATLIYDTVSFYPAVMTGPFMWFKFTATDTIMRLHVYQNHPDQQFNVDTVRLLQGSCSGGFSSLTHVSTPVYENELMKEMYLEFDELEIDSTYYVRLRQGEDESSLPILAFRRMPPAYNGPTWSGRNQYGIKDTISIGELIYSKCATCHNPLGAASHKPHWTNRDTVDHYRLTIFGRIDPACGNAPTCLMMPYWKPVYPDSTYPRFSKERVLTDAEIQAIQTWAFADFGVTNSPVRNGHEPYPLMPHFGPELDSSEINLSWEISDPYPGGYSPDIDCIDDYQNFVFQNPESVDVYISKIEFTIDTGVFVHHVMLSQDTTISKNRNTTIITSADTIITCTDTTIISADTTFVPCNPCYESEAKDTADHNPGYGGSASMVDGKMIAAWAPGTGLVSLPCNFGIKLEANKPLLLQVHYPKRDSLHAHSGSGVDMETGFKIQYSSLDSASIREIFVSPIGEPSPGGAAFTDSIGNPDTNDLDVAANTQRTIYLNATFNQAFNDTLTPPDTVSIIGIFPHMHLRGETFEMYAAGSINDTSKIQMMKLEKWEIMWQEVYYYRQPVIVDNTNKFFIKAHYNNTSSNLNLDSTKSYAGLNNFSTQQGLNTTDEMLIGMLYWAAYQPGDSNMLMDPNVPGYVKADAGLDRYLCTGETTQLGVPPDSAITYVWNPSTYLSDDSASNPMVTKGPINSYTLTATDTFGCSSTTTVSVGGNCDPSVIEIHGQKDTLDFINPNLSTICARVTYLDSIDHMGHIMIERKGCANKVIDLSVFGYDIIVKITGTLTVDSNYTIKNCTNTTNGLATYGGFRFAPDAKIVIPSNKTLTLDNSYFSACEGEMWKGIIVNPGATLNSKNNTVIADAIAAMSGHLALGSSGGATGTGKLILQNTRFYRNFTGVYTLFNFSGLPAITGCEFKYDTTQALMNYMLPPYCGEHPHYGINAIYGNPLMVWNVGNYPFSPTDKIANTFDGLNCGINTLRSNIRVNSNYFKNIRNYDNIGVVAGKAIYHDGYLQSVLAVKTHSNDSVAAFANCDYGAYINNSSAYIGFNKLNNVKNGIYVRNCNGRHFQILDNVIEDANAAITLNK